MENGFEDERTSIHFYVLTSNANELRRILSETDQDINLGRVSSDGTPSTPLQLAIRTGRFSMAEILLRYHASIDLVTPWEQDTLLNHCVSAPFHHDYYMTPQKRLDLVSLLLRYNANTEHKNSRGMTPLRTAAKYRDLAKVSEMLIRHRSDINTQDNAGVTPLMQSVLEGHLAQFDVLLTHGADVFLQDIHGATVLDMVEHQEHYDIFGEVSDTMRNRINIARTRKELNDNIDKCVQLAMWRKREASPLHKLLPENIDHIANAACEDLRAMLKALKDL
jgi:ankyrin repeat protein